MNYWEECIAEAFDDAKISADKEQIKLVASWVEGAHDNYGMANGYDCIPNPLMTENAELRTKLENERDKIICKKCGGRGSIIRGDDVRSSQSSCSKCCGTGRHDRRL